MPQQNLRLAGQYPFLADRSEARDLSHPDFSRVLRTA
jgi:hypothetical protein